MSQRGEQQRGKLEEETLIMLIVCELHGQPDPVKGMDLDTTGLCTLLRTVYGLKERKGTQP